MVNPKNAFWQALLSAAIIFGVGILLGVFLENSRSQSIEATLINSEVSVADQQLISQITDNLEIDCNLAVNNTIALADKIYEEASLLEKYDKSSELTGTLKLVHRKYDLLRTGLWLHSINIKNKCKSDFHTLVYIYQYQDVPISTASRQTVFANYLREIKSSYKDKIILIPIAGDTDLFSLNLIKDKFSIKDYPVIILDEKRIIKDVESLTSIESILEQ